MITMLNHRAHTDIGLASLLLQGDHGQIAFESSSIYRDRDRAWDLPVRARLRERSFIPRLCGGACFLPSERTYRQVDGK